MNVSKRRNASFRKTVYAHYRKAGRRFAWRETTDPYGILVSELMLQQTQTSRVVPYYDTFLGLFPTFEALAAAPLASVLAAWQGLGYNRRAVFLKRMAEVVAREYGGRLPETEVLLLALPGIGKYTAAAILSFAFNRPAVLLETNVRAVYLHCFFANRVDVTDKEIEAIVAQTIDSKNPRKWFYALMDYGVEIKKRTPRLNARSAHYTKQSKFVGSVREIRGRILKVLSGSKKMSVVALLKAVESDEARFEKAFAGLMNEGIIVERRGKIGIGE